MIINEIAVLLVCVMGRNRAQTMSGIQYSVNDGHTCEINLLNPTSVTRKITSLLILLSDICKNTDNSNCLQVFNSKINTHNGLMIAFLPKIMEKNEFIVGGIYLLNDFHNFRNL